MCNGTSKQSYLIQRYTKDRKSSPYLLFFLFLLLPEWGYDNI